MIIALALCCGLVHGAVLINEIAPSGAPADWIELFNNGSSAVDLAGWWLSDSDEVERQNTSFVFAATAIEAGSFLTVSFLAANSSEIDALSTTLFRLNSDGETLTLVAANGELQDRVTYADPGDAASVGRVPDGAATWFEFAEATRGANNSGAPAGGAAVVRDADWRQDSHSKKKTLPLYDAVFDMSQLQRLELEFEPGAWQTCWDSMTKLAGEFGVAGFGGGFLPRSNNMTQGGGGGGSIDLLGGEATYVPVTVRFKGRVWRKVAFRWKGNSSLRSSWSAGVYKLPFRLDFDGFEDDFPAVKNQRFFGFGKMTASSNFGDGTGMRELLMQALYANMDVPAARGAPVQVLMDRGTGEPKRVVGIYTLIEDPGDGEGLARRVFADDGSGNVYKPDGQGARFTTPLVTASFELKTGGKVDGNWTDVARIVEAVHASTRKSAPAAWRAQLERVFDVNLFVRWIAVTRNTGNWDQYGGMAHNYYLYARTGRPAAWVAWDGNFVFGASIGGGGGGMMGGNNSMMAPPPGFNPGMLPPPASTRACCRRRASRCRPASRCRRAST